MSRLFSYINAPLLSIALVLLLGFSTVSEAKNWQLLLLPEGTNHVVQPEAMAQFEDGVSLALSQGFDTLIAHEKVFADCSQAWCGQLSLSTALQLIREKANKVQLVIVYAFEHSAINDGSQQNAVELNIRLIDPLSHSIRFSDKIIQVAQTANIDFFTLGEKIGQLVQARLKEITPFNTYKLSLSGFSSDELSGLSTYILSHSPTANLSLTNASNENSWFAFAVLTREYHLQSSLSATQVNQLLQQFFTRQNVNINAQYTQSTQQVIVKRIGNPFALTITMSIILFGLSFVLLSILIRRQYLNYHLHQYSAARNASAWLEIYRKAKFSLYGLKRKWSSQASYWRKQVRDSDDLNKQAQVYFDAGDMNTAKLFLAKALHANSANTSANDLVNDVINAEKNIQQLSENEQWIRKKIVQAMQSYRQQQPSKALRRAYQAYDRARQIKELKRQAKAIKKLINNIKIEFTVNMSAISFKNLNTANTYLITQHQNIHIGRSSNTSDKPFIGEQDSVFYVNHKSVSRIGQQCKIKRLNDTFYLIDMGSKNGSLLNQLACEAKQSYPLKNGDIIQLGAKTIAAAVRLLVTLSDNGEVLQLSFAQQASALLDKLELNKIWPEHTLALRTTLVCIKRASVVLFNSSTHEMRITHNAEGSENKLKDESGEQQNEFTAICKIELGNNATISPIDNPLSLYIDSVRLLGEVPLILPCNLVLKEANKLSMSFYVSEYDSAVMLHADSTLLAATMEQ